jgi:cytochrome c oxidase subunit 3
VHQVGEQYETAEQQGEANRLGMWLFIASEILLFGGLFTGYTAYRLTRDDGFAEASGHLYAWIGIVNTVVLLLSSLTMALAVNAVHARLRRASAWLLAMTAALGLGFLALKGVEYALDYRESVVPVLNFDASKFDHPAGARLFFTFYYIMTGLHATHLIVAVALVAISAVRAARGTLTLGPTGATEPLGLYWHLVDIIWVFLLPLLYFLS